MSEMEFFKLFFTHQIVSSIVAHTNSYAFIKVASGGYSNYTDSHGDWNLTNNDEIYRLISLLIYFSLVTIRFSVQKYWSTKTLYHGLWARSIMPLKRFKALMAFLHVVDPSNEDPSSKLRKVEEFIYSFKERCHVLYQPSQNIAVDERMVKSKHRSGLRQFMKDKTIKWGLKLWVLADSLNGYTIDFDVYVGKTSKPISEHGLGYDVVMKLVQPYFNQGYHVCFDNFYTSHQLVKDLFLRGTPSSGTVRTSRKSFPKAFADAKKWGGSVGRGSMRWQRDGVVVTIQWSDNNPVSLLSSIDTANYFRMVERRVKGKNGFEKINVR